MTTISDRYRQLAIQQGPGRDLAAAILVLAEEVRSAAVDLGAYYERSVVAMDRMVHLAELNALRAAPATEAPTISDERLREIRSEARAVGELELSRACSAALGLPTGDGCGGLIDGPATRRRIAEREDRGCYAAYRAPTPVEVSAEAPRPPRECSACRGRGVIAIGADETRDCLGCNGSGVAP